jgi:hypothetical protein
VILDSTLKTIEVVLEGAITTNQLDVTAAYADTWPSGPFVPGEQDESTNGGTPVTAVAAPPANVQRMVNEIRVYNKDTVLHTITIQLNNNGTRRVLQKQPASPGAVVVYAPSGGTLADLAPLDFIELESGSVPQKISAMAAASLPFDGTEIIPVIQGGANDQFAIADVLNQTGTITAAVTQITFNANGATGPGTFVAFLSADASSGTQSPEMDFISGNATGGGVNSGPVFLGSGNSAAAESGTITQGSGTAGTNSGAVLLASGDAGANSGDLQFLTGNSTTAGNTGPVTVVTGNSTSGNSGDITLTIGSASGGGNHTGSITLTLTAGAGGATNGNLLIVNLPTSSAGLPSNAIWCDTGAGNVLKRV